ncbi:hypothetical protein GGR53DRAFT_531096 [Hypoxylon sp. FL1150]|nr:hypothetical protein GGR53DRAFT_531096 [Hypoxylon sp. FL1150]
MEDIVQAPDSPLIMVDGYVRRRGESTLSLVCLSSAGRIFTAEDDSGYPLFHASGLPFGMSLSGRCNVHDVVAGRRLFDFRHHLLGYKSGWVVESLDGDKLCSVRREKCPAGHLNIVATVPTQGDVLVTMWPNLHEANTAMAVCFDRKIVARIDLVDTPGMDDPDTRSEQERTACHAYVAAGVDLSLIMVLMLCCSEIGHSWN